MVYKAYREGRAEGVERRRIANAKEKRVKKQKNMQEFSEFVLLQGEFL